MGHPDLSGAGGQRKPLEILRSEGSTGELAVLLGSALPLQANDPLHEIDGPRDQASFGPFRFLGLVVDSELNTALC